MLALLLHLDQFCELVHLVIFIELKLFNGNGERGSVETEFEEERVTALKIFNMRGSLELLGHHVSDHRRQLFPRFFLLTEKSLEGFYVDFFGLGDRPSLFVKLLPHFVVNLLIFFEGVFTNKVLL